MINPKMRAILIVGLIYGAVMLYIGLAPIMASHNMFTDLSARMAQISASK